MLSSTFLTKNKNSPIYGFRQISVKLLFHSGLGNYASTLSVDVDIVIKVYTYIWEAYVYAISYVKLIRLVKVNTLTELNCDNLIDHVLSE